jgi:hypothetical protein
MQVLVPKRKGKFNQFGIYLVNFHNLLLHIVLLCQESVTIKNIMIMLLILQDMIYQKYILAKLTFGFPLIMVKFTSHTFLLNTLIKKVVSNMLS